MIREVRQLEEGGGERMRSGGLSCGKSGKAGRFERTEKLRYFDLNGVK